MHIQLHLVCSSSGTLMELLGVRKCTMQASHCSRGCRHWCKVPCSCECNTAFYRSGICIRGGGWGVSCTSLLLYVDASLWRPGTFSADPILKKASTTRRMRAVEVRQC